MFWLFLLATCLSLEIPLEERTNGPKASLSQLGLLEKRIDLTQVYSSSESSTQSQFDPVFVQNNQGWYPFTFGPGNSGFYALESFYVYAGTWGGILSITDCFCAGDKFLVYDNGVQIANLSQCGDHYGDSECLYYEENPQACFASYAYCKGAFELTPGPHNITLQVTRAIMLGGTGYIRYQAYGRCGGIDCELRENCINGVADIDSSSSSSSSCSSSSSSSSSNSS